MDESIMGNTKYYKYVDYIIKEEQYNYVDKIMSRNDKNMWMRSWEGMLHILCGWKGIIQICRWGYERAGNIQICG